MYLLILTSSYTNFSRLWSKRFDKTVNCLRSILKSITQFFRRRLESAIGSFCIQCQVEKSKIIVRLIDRFSELRTPCSESNTSRTAIESCRPHEVLSWPDNPTTQTHRSHALLEYLDVALCIVAIARCARRKTTVKNRTSTARARWKRLISKTNH